MRKPDAPVREVVCSETNKPMPKIPLWMADVKVKFISDEARQKHPATPSLNEIEPIRRSISSPDIDGLRDLDIVSGSVETDEDASDSDVEADDSAEDDYAAED